ncbi:MAG: GPI ethanolamine phosphate transferase 3-like, partial [Trebouxia sp. A1-2]
IELPNRSLPADSLACIPEPPVRKLVWIIIDALRWDFVSNRTGSSNKLGGMLILQDIANAAGQAALLTKFVADPPTTTMQRLKGLMTGGLPTFIDVGSSFSAAAVTEDNLIDQLRHHDKQLAFFGDDTWMQLFPTQFQRAIPFPSFNVMDLHTVDDGVWQVSTIAYSEHATDNLIPSIRKPADWDVVIGHYLGVDHAGHTYDVHSPHMAAKLQQMNQYVEQVVEELVSMAGPGEAHEHTLLLVFGDHGQTLTGDHGGGAPEEVDSALFALNLGAYHQIRHQQEVCTTSESDTGDQAERMLDSSMPQIDFAPSVAALMGVPIPFGNIGQISEELWNVAHSTSAFMNASQVHGSSLCQEPYIEALWLNAAQVHTYLNAYAAHGRASLPKAHLHHLNQLYQQAVASNNNHSNEASSSRTSKDRAAGVQCLVGVYGTRGAHRA